MNEPSETPAPINPRERIVTLDILRGFALLGVVLVNTQSMISWGEPAQLESPVPGMVPGDIRHWSVL